MKTVIVTGPGRVEIMDVPIPSAGPTDVLVRMRACGICGSDSFYIARGGIPPREGATPLGHEPAGEVVEVGDRVEGIRPGDHVVINPMAHRDGIIGNGGPTGALSEFLGSRHHFGNSVRWTGRCGLGERLAWPGRS
jgi:L-iditol 2-dehydrogenase